VTTPEFQDDGRPIRAALEALAGEDVEVIATSRAPSSVAAMPSATDLTAAAVVVDLSRAVVDAGARHLATTGDVDRRRAQGHTPPLDRRGRRDGASHA
jgi:hypothetical protein